MREEHALFPAEDDLVAVVAADFGIDRLGPRQSHERFRWRTSRRRRVRVARGSGGDIRGSGRRSKLSRVHLREEVI